MEGYWAYWSIILPCRPCLTAPELLASAVPGLVRQLPEAQRLYHELVGSRFGHPVKEHVAKGCNRIVRYITISTCKFQQTKGTDLREAKSLHVVHILVYIIYFYLVSVKGNCEFCAQQASRSIASGAGSFALGTSADPKLYCIHQRKVRNDKGGQEHQSVFLSE